MACGGAAAPSPPSTNGVASPKGVASTAARRNRRRHRRRPQGHRRQGLRVLAGQRREVQARPGPRQIVAPHAGGASTAGTWNVNFKGAENPWTGIRWKDGNRLKLEEGPPDCVSGRSLMMAGGSTSRSAPYTHLRRRRRLARTWNVNARAPSIPVVVGCAGRTVLERRHGLAQDRLEKSASS